MPPLPSAPPPAIHWEAGTAPARLVPGALHLWRIHAGTQPPALDARCATSLCAAEHARARRLRAPRHRHRFLVSHLAIREILGGYLHCAPAAVRFVQSPTGKPSLADAALPIEFNASTSGDLTLLALRLHEPLGIDVEMLSARVDMLGIARRMFSPAQTEQIGRLHGSARLVAFYAAWTALEARVKRDGRGLPGHREADPPDMALIHASALAGAICAIAGRGLPARHVWIARDWQEAAQAA